jgi:hypothetical protein
VFTIPTLTQYSDRMTEFLEKIRQEEEIKRIQIGKEVKIIPI